MKNASESAEKKKHRTNECTRIAISKSMVAYAEGGGEGCEFDQKTGEPYMSHQLLADLYGCTLVYAKFITKHGVHSIMAVEKLCEIFNIKKSEFMALGESS